MSKAVRISVGALAWVALWALTLAVVVFPLLMAYPWGGGAGQVPDVVGIAVVAYGYATAIGLAVWLSIKMAAAR